MFKKISLCLLGIAVSCILIFCLNLYRNQEVILLKAKPLESSYQFSSDYDFSEVYLTTNDNATIHALLYKVKNPKGIVLYYHGRGGNLGTDWASVADNFLERNYQVLIMDYRSFGKSKGALSEKALLNDAELIYRYARESFDPPEIILYGRSFGTGIATYIASKYPSKLLILEAPYFSILDMAQKKFPFFPKILTSLILKYPLRTDLWIQNVDSPIELFHGTEDALIPFESSKRLFSLISHKKKTQLNTISEATHNNITDQEKYLEKLDLLLK